MNQLLLSPLPQQLPPLLLCHIIAMIESKHRLLGFPLKSRTTAILMMTHLFRKWIISILRVLVPSITIVFLTIILYTIVLDNRNYLLKNPRINIILFFVFHSLLLAIALSLIYLLSTLQPLLFLTGYSDPDVFTI